MEKIETQNEHAHPSVAVVYETIDTEHVDKVYKLITDGFEDTNKNSMLTQHMTKEEFINDAENKAIKKVLVFSSDKTEILGYGSVITDDKCITWMDISEIKENIGFNENDVLLSSGSIIIKKTQRGYENAERLVGEVGKVFNNIYNECEERGLKFGVAIDCAPTNITFPDLIKYILNKTVGPTTMELVGYKTSVLINTNTDYPSEECNSSFLRIGVEQSDVCLSEYFFHERGIDTKDVGTYSVKNSIEKTNLHAIHIPKALQKKFAVFQFPISTSMSVNESEDKKSILHVEDQSIWVAMRKKEE
jgi:hypothetical protein